LLQFFDLRLQLSCLPYTFSTLNNFIFSPLPK
jgi:hypothetical protein